MADIFDQATERETRDREGAIKEALRTSRLSILKPNGRCYNCLAELPADRPLFCDSDCSADHELRVRARSRN